MPNTINYGWPQPIPTGIQQEEIAKIAAALAGVDASLAAIAATQTTHTHTFASLTGRPTTLSGYGITNAYTRTETDNAITALRTQILGGATAAFDTLLELQNAIGGDANFAATMAASIGTKATLTQNLADLPDKSVSRDNLSVYSRADSDNRYIPFATSIALTDAQRRQAINNLDIFEVSISNVGTWNDADNTRQGMGRSLLQGTATGGPGGGSGGSNFYYPLNVHYADGESITQIALPYTTGGAAPDGYAYIRQRYNNTWSGWARLGHAEPSEIAFFARDTPPPGFIKANGAALSRTVYARLFAAIGTRFGAGDGTTTFNIPDLRGEFIRGWDDGRGIDVERALGTLQLDAVENHTHDATASTNSHTHNVTGTAASAGAHSHTVSGTAASAGAHSHTYASRVSGSVGAAGSANAALEVDTHNTSTAGAHSHSVSGTAASAGAHTHTVSGTTDAENHTHTITVAAGGGGTETRPRNVAMLACIRY